VNKVNLTTKTALQMSHIYLLKTFQLFLPDIKVCVL